jgi:tRNA U55 pseudouridine synthase TruB
VGTGACLEALRRTRSGDFGIDGAIDIDELHEDPEAASGWIVPLERLLPNMPSVTVTDEGRLRVSHGRDLETVHYALKPTPEGAWIRILDAEGRLAAVGQAGGAEGSIHPDVVLI